MSFSEKKLPVLYIISFFLNVLILVYWVLFETNMLSWISFSISTLLLFISIVIFPRRDTLYYKVFMIYHLMFLSSFFVQEESLKSLLPSNIMPFIILPILCFLLIVPIFFLKRPQLTFLNADNKTEILCYCLIPLIIISTIYLLPYTFNTFIYGASAVRSGGANSDYWNKMPNTLFNTFCIGISMLYPLYLMLLFYCISFNKNKILISGMILGVICGLIGGLVFATRDRFIYLAIFLIFNIWLWRPYLINSPLYNMFKKILFLFLFIVVLFFLWITLDRFSEGFSAAVSSNLAYYGYQPYVFAELVERFNDFYGLGYNFPLFFELQDNIDRRDHIFWMWGTSFQNIYIMGGWLYCFAYVFTFIISSIFVIKFIKRDSWLYLIFILFYFQMVSQGVFYFNLGFEGGNFYIILLVFIALILNFWKKIKLER